MFFRAGVLILYIIKFCVAQPNVSAYITANPQSDGSYEFYFNRDTLFKFNNHFKDYEPSLLFDTKVAAAIWFNDSISTIGWSFQTIKTSSGLDDVFQAYWAGFLEGNVSKSLSHAHFYNSFAGFCLEPLSEPCSILKNYLSINLKHIISLSQKMGDVDPYWYQIELQLWQIRGLMDGLANVFVKNSKTLSPVYLEEIVDNIFGVYLLQLAGDLSEIMDALSLQMLKIWSYNGVTYHVPKPGCSALIKTLPEQSDVYLSHTTWNSYSSMLRVMKYNFFPWKYTRNSNSDLIPGQEITFSSYPSTLTSIDDFYLTGCGLITMETTFGNSNTKLWDLVRNGLPTTVLHFFRVNTANRLARSPQEWISYFSRENSGTYNNQWMIFDAKIIKPGLKLPLKDLLWVAEQLPGIVVSDDVTNILLNKSYWPSYNLPYFKSIYNLSGILDVSKIYGSWFTYDKSPRAQIFKRNHSRVDSLEKMFRLMRYNDFKHDEFSRCNCSPPYSGENGISARSDLNPSNGTYPFDALSYRLHGATDVKLVNLQLAINLSLIAISSPTYDQQPPFQWSKLRPPVELPKLHPDKWHFPAIYFSLVDGVLQPYPFNGSKLPYYLP